MNEVVSQFAEFIRSSRFDTERAGQKTVERCEIVFKDNSRLVAYESVTGTKSKYAYQWMNPANETIYRWDNTPHFPQFATYPYHRHVGPSEIAEPFPIISLTDVFHFITEQITIESVDG